MANLHPFSSALEQMFRIKSGIEEIKFRREQQQMQREHWAQQMEDRQAARQQQDFRDRLAIHAIGGHELTPQMEQSDATLKGFFGQAQPGYQRETIKTPTGQKFQLASEADEDRMATREGTRKGMARKAEDDITDPEEDVELPGVGTLKVPHSKKADFVLKVWEKKNPNLQSHVVQNHETGDMTLIGVNPQTNEIVKQQTIPGIAGKTERAAGTEKTGLSSGALEAMQKAQEAINSANSNSPKNENDLTTPEQRWQAAHAAVQQAIAAFPDELDGGKGGGGFPFILPKEGHTQGRQRGMPAGQTGQPPASGQQSGRVYTSAEKTKMLMNYRNMDQTQRTKKDPKIGMSPHDWLTKVLGKDPDDTWNSAP